MTLFDTDATMRSILANNIYGVDINQESVEITRLALWLRTALPDRPLTSLDNNIRCGNSLIETDFYSSEQGHFDFSEEERERINTFNWSDAFPDVLSDASPRRGFDCVVGNPPYVKLQHFRTYQPQMAEYLSDGQRDGNPIYESTQTGNFDMYLPFIETGMRLLCSTGRMGFIAPSLWPLNNYGEGLRGHLLEHPQLDRWVDFKYYQVFDEAITYTALQFFRGAGNANILYVACPKGEKDLAMIEWDKPDGTIPYSELPEDDAWIFQPDNVRSLMKRLTDRFTPLGDPTWTTAIFQGIKTSADPVYVLKKIANGRYLFEEGDVRREWPIEDAICRPIASGTGTKRYADPPIEDYLLFPYNLSVVPPKLYTPSQMLVHFPLAWKYFQSNEARLRARESSAFDEDDSWHAFSRPQNMEKQALPKLLVAGTAPELRVARDETGELSTLGGRVYSVLPSTGVPHDYLLAILNSSVANFYFVHRARPKSGGFFDAETQNLSPIPIPKVDENVQEKITGLAIALRNKWTKRHAALVRLSNTLASSQAFDDHKSESWLWADIHDKDYWIAANPESLSGRALKKWAKEKVEVLTTAHLQQLETHLRPTEQLKATLVDGELSLHIDGESVLTVFPEQADGRAEFLAAQWKLFCRCTNVTEAFNAKKLVTGLLALRHTDERALRDQVVMLDRQLDALETEILQHETDLNELVYDAYELADEERELVRQSAN